MPLGSMQHLIASNHIIRTQTKHFLRASNIDLWQEELTPTFYQTDKYINVIDLWHEDLTPTLYQTNNCLNATNWNREIIKKSN
jgi:hypothetical protein